MSLRVAIVEDDDFTRVMISNALIAGGLEISFLAASAADALRSAKSSEFDVALIDLHLGKGPTGIDLAISMRALYPKLGLVLLTSYEDPRLLQPNIPDPPEGCSYVLKSEISDLATLIDRIRESHRVSSSLPFGSPGSGSASTRLGLTDSQIETLRLVGLGYSNAEIAKKRFVTEKSVEMSILRLAKKLGIERASNQNQRVHMAKALFRSIGYRIDE